MFLMIKPASGACNLECDYCFYKNEMKNRPQASFGIMEKETAKALIQSVFLALSPGEPVTFGFQGGEPLLAGLSFFTYFVETVRQCNQKKHPVSYVLQTNGTLVDDAFASFFAENHFLIGISIDGPKSLHDQYRKDACKQGSFLKTMEAVRLLQAKQVELNALVVIHRKNAMQIRKVYSFLQKQGLSCMQFIPCLDPLKETPGAREYSLTPGLYAEAMISLFDIWYEDYQARRYVYIRQFENWVGILKRYEPEACSMSGRCSVQNIVEADGQIYPCDFYVLDEYALGNVKDYDWSQKKDCRFLQESKAVRLSAQSKCSECSFVKLCRGGCRREMFLSGQLWENYFCSAYKQIFTAISDRLQKL